MNLIKFLILGFLLAIPKLFGKKAKPDESVWKEVPNFDWWEFDSPDKSGSGKNMDAEFIRLLQIIRGLYGKPMIINSGFRTHRHNQKLVEQLGASKNSAHKKGLAADIHVDNLEDMETLVFIAKTQGIKRIGQYISHKGNYFIHLDIDSTKSYQGMWAKNKGKNVPLFVNPQII